MRRTLRTERGGEGTAYKKHPNRKEADLSSQPARNHSHFSFSVAAAVGCAWCCWHGVRAARNKKTRPQGPRGTSPRPLPPATRPHAYLHHHPDPFTT